MGGPYLPGTTTARLLATHAAARASCQRFGKGSTGAEGRVLAESVVASQPASCASQPSVSAGGGGAMVAAATARRSSVGSTAHATTYAAYAGLRAGSVCLIGLPLEAPPRSRWWVPPNDGRGSACLNLRLWLGSAGVSEART